MADSPEILGAAGNLGALIATHPAVSAYKETMRLGMYFAAREATDLFVDGGIDVGHGNDSFGGECTMDGDDCRWSDAW